jgi:hypothetical protein
MTGIAKTASIVTLMFLFSLPAHSDVRLGVLDFELIDLTEIPRGPEEIERTASLKPLLESSLAAKGYRITPVDRAAQSSAVQAVGYLWDHPDEVAAGWSSDEAQFVVVGRVRKPSYLFVYLEVRLIDVKAKKVVDEVYVEVKGQQRTFTPKGVENLARQIDSGLKTLSASQAAAVQRESGVSRTHLSANWLGDRSQDRSGGR